MVDVSPFRAIRYRCDEPGALSKRIAPPYDVISPALQDTLYEQHPNNIVRMDLNREEDGDTETSRYERAAQFLTDWKDSGVLSHDQNPAFYFLSQRFHGPDGVERTRTGFFGCARITPFGEGPILPHERTLKGPKLDRLRLFRATKTNLSPIFGMYCDPDERVQKVLNQAKSEKPLAAAEASGVQNELWAVTDPTLVQEIQDALRARKLYIADGHHRYETGLAYRNERRALNEAPSNEGDEPGYENILVFMARVEDPGMVVFPTHRLVHSLADFDEARILDALGAYFTLSEAPSDASLTERLKTAGAKTNAFALASRSRTLLLERKQEAHFDAIETHADHPALKDLDVAILHGVILEHILGISKEAQATQQNLRYSKDLIEALEAPRQGGDVQLAFLMNPTKISEVIEVSESGQVMPQKSTFFYPKIPSGLVLYPLE